MDADLNNEWSIEMSDWQPIESAPKDETDVLLFLPDPINWDLPMRTAWWFEDEEDQNQSGWYDNESSSHKMTDLYGQPSHWMPLPEPPKGAY